MSGIRTEKNEKARKISLTKNKKDGGDMKNEIENKVYICITSQLISFIYSFEFPFFSIEISYKW